MKISQGKHHRARLGIALATLLTMFLVLLVATPSPALAVGSYNNAAIADRSLTYLGQWGGNACRDAGKPQSGQCKQFANCIVSLISGGSQYPAGGSSYHGSYSAAGGIEVNRDQAVKGDIIQVGDNANDSPHTAIVIARLPDGKFDVVDSNFGWDEMVSRHTYTAPSRARFWRMGTIPPIEQMDADGDGILDAQDRCPRLAGAAQNRGCPLDGHTVTGRFHGNDNLTDVLTFYDYGDDKIGAWVFPGTTDATATGIAREANLWTTPTGTWNWSASKFVAGNFAGDDAYTDVIGFYDYGNDEMGAWLFRGGSGGLSREQLLWRTGSGHWNMANGNTFLVGDFAGNDGRDDIIGLYNYGSDEMGSWVFHGNGNGVTREQFVWRTGTGKWNMKNSKFVAGEFNGSSGTDLLAFYDYGSDEMGTWLFPGASLGVGREQFKWHTGTGQWNQARATYVAGNFAGSSTLTDVIAFYDFGNDELGLWSFEGNGSGVGQRTFRWRTGTGKWNAVNSKWFALGKNTAGWTDVIAMYNHGSDNLGAWRFPGVSGSVGREAKLWWTGNGQWNWVSM